MTDLKIEKIKVSDIKPYPKNAKLHTAEQISKIRDSIQSFGYNDPIALDEKNEIIEGHGRLEAIKQINSDPNYEIQVIRLEGLDENQKKAYRIAHNKLNMMTDFDIDLLKEEFHSLEDTDNFNDTGFESNEISEIWDQDIETKEDDFKVPDEPKYNITPGEIWQLGNHRLMCGDSTNNESVKNLMNGIKADVCFHSPPYNVGHNLGYKTDSKYISSDDNMKDYDRFLTTTTTNSINNANDVFINLQFLANNKHDIIKFIYNLNEYFKDILYWKKLQVAPAMAKNIVNSQVEVILLFGLNNNRSFGNKEFRGNLSNYLETKSNNDNKNSDVHNAGYPIELPSIFFRHAYKENSSVLDLFGGTGTTLIACEQLKRKCFMMELDPYYCSVIIERWEKLTSKKAEKLT